VSHCCNAREKSNDIHANSTFSFSSLLASRALLLYSQVAGLSIPRPHENAELDALFLR
jgi:hypothetical protein